MTGDIEVLHALDSWPHRPDALRSCEHITHVSDLADKARALGHQVERLTAANAAWMNGVADAVEPLGFDRHAASGPADLLPGLSMLADEIVRLRAELAAHTEAERIMKEGL